MVQRVATVAFEGIEARAVDVQVQVAPGLPAFNVVGLPDKAVSEARERVRAALVASGLALPARRITVNLAPADLPKEGSHYDLPIALGLMAAIGAIPADALAGFTVLGELGLDGSIAAVAGVLPAAIGANARGEGLICPAACGPEAAWASPEMEIVAAGSLIQLANHFRGTQVLSRPQPKIREVEGALRRSEGHQGPGKRQARARSRRRRRAQSADGRAARRRQVDAGGAAADDPAAADAGRTARSLDDRLGRRRDRRRRADQPAAVPQPASFRQHAGAGRRRPARAAGRGVARASRRAVSRRVSRVRAAGARLAAPAARNRRGRDRARQPSRHLSGALHAGRRHEPVPLRPRQRTGLCLQARAERALRGRLPGAAVGPAARPHRPAHRGAGGHRRRSHPAAAGGRQPRGRRARRARARDAGASATRRSACRMCAPTRRRRARCSKRWRGPMPRDLRCCATPPTRCGSPRAAITACCGWRARSPISTAPRRSAACISPRRCPIAHSPTRSAARRERCRACRRAASALTFPHRHPLKSAKRIIAASTLPRACGAARRASARDCKESAGKDRRHKRVVKQACAGAQPRTAKARNGMGGGHAGDLQAHCDFTRAFGTPPGMAVRRSRRGDPVDVVRRGVRLPGRDEKPGRALRSAYVRDRRRRPVRRGLRRNRSADFAQQARARGTARAAGARRRPRRPQLGAQGERGAREELSRSAGRPDRAPRQRRAASPMSTTPIARSPAARATSWSAPRSRCRSSSRARPRCCPTARASTTRRSRPPPARAGSPGARSRCATARRPRCKASAATSPTASSAERALADARDQAEAANRRQVALPCHGLARDSHAAQRHPRHGRSAARHAAHAGADRPTPRP